MIPTHLRHLLLAAAILLPACNNRPQPAEGMSDAAPPPAGPHYGDVMAAMGRRFELAGRAAAAGRYELAAFEIDEMKEVLDDDLPMAAPPRESKGADLHALADALRKNNVPELERAVKARDTAAVKQAFATTASACNGCHQTTGHGFIEIAPDPGASVPRLDPLPAAKP